MAEATKTDQRKNQFSLVELLMILMLVGIVFVFWIPMRDAKINQQKTQEAITNLKTVAEADVAFKNSDLGGGSYAFDISQLNLNMEKKYFDYTVTDSTVVATSTPTFGKAKVSLYYFLPNGPYKVNDDPVSTDIIDENWLP